MLILTAVLTNSLVTNLCMLFGMNRENAESLGFIAMMITALIMYTRITKHRRK
ncbi:hypothetical protein [Paenibacillus lemnae]|nr:hypothetical protein [Paenibacillus lemnae]